MVGGSVRWYGRAVACGLPLNEQAGNTWCEPLSFNLRNGRSPDCPRGCYAGDRFGFTRCGLRMITFGPVDASLVRWADRSELSSLSHVASPNCIDAWDGVTQRVAVAWRDGKPVGVAWIATDSFREDELGTIVWLLPSQAWLYAAHVLPHYRRQGIYRSLLGFVTTQLATESKRELLLGVTVGNQPSVRAHEEQGARTVGAVVLVRFLGICFASCRGRIHRQSRLPFGSAMSLDCAASDASP